MELTEKRILASVTVLLETRTIQVLWNHVIYRGEVEISRVNFRRSYMEEEKELFLADVPDGWTYIQAVGWA